MKAELTSSPEVSFSWTSIQSVPADRRARARASSCSMGEGGRDGCPWRRHHVSSRPPLPRWGTIRTVASYSVNPRAVERARRLIRGRQYVLDSEWGEVQPKADAENAFLRSHTWDEYAEWHLGLTEGATDETKARYAFVYGDFRRLHRSGIIACHYRAAEWRHKEVELAAHELLQLLDETSS
jgi:hypothetical protein